MNWFKRFLKWILGLFTPPKPGRITLASKKELGMTRFGIKFQLPAPGASDVATRELSIAVNDQPATLTTVPGNTLVTDELTFNAGDLLTVMLTDIDGAGNRSPQSDPFHYTVVDDIAPPQPPAPVISAKRQID